MNELWHADVCHGPALAIDGRSVPLRIHALLDDHPIFLLDEAHLLHQDVFEHLHILANHDWDARALLSLVLVGIPETRDRLSLHKKACRSRLASTRGFASAKRPRRTPPSTSHSA